MQPEPALSDRSLWSTDQESVGEREGQDRWIHGRKREVPQARELQAGYAGCPPQGGDLARPQVGTMLPLGALLTPGLSGIANDVVLAGSAVFGQQPCTT